MTTIENQFMNEHFNNLPLWPAFFYSWEVGIRFEISMPGEEHEDPHNLRQINERSTEIFNHVFHGTDELLLITDIHCDETNTFLRKRPVKVYQKYVRNRRLLHKLQHRTLPNVFSEDDTDDEKMLTHRFFLSCKKSDIRYHQLLSAISYEDFPHPTRILKRSYKAGYDIYFINVTKKMIYHLYDDRGCDVIAADKEDLRQLYTSYNDWILDYDRDQIDRLFQPIS